MTDPAATPLDNQIEAITRDFAKRLDELATMPALRSGLLTAAIGDLIWTLYHDMPDVRHDLADALEGFPQAIRDAIKNDAG